MSRTTFLGRIKGYFAISNKRSLLWAACDKKAYCSLHYDQRGMKKRSLLLILFAITIFCLTLNTLMYLRKIHETTSHTGNTGTHSARPVAFSMKSDHPLKKWERHGLKIEESFNLTNVVGFNGTILYQRRFQYPPYVLPFPTFINKRDYVYFSNFSMVREQYDAYKHCTHPVCLENDFGEYGAAFLGPENYLAGNIDVIQEVTVWCDAAGCGSAGCNKEDCNRTCGFGSVGSEWWRNNATFTTRTYDDRLLYVEPPQSWAFQHWLPDLFPKLIQAWDILQDPTVKLLTAEEILTDPTPDHFKKFLRNLERELPKNFMRPFAIAFFKVAVFVLRSRPVNQSPTVGYLQKYLGIEHRVTEFPSAGGDVGITEMINGCMAPGVHPFLWKEMNFQLGVNSSTPMDKVILLARNKNTATNGGRYLVNEDEVIEVLKNVCERAGLEFVLFNHQEYTSVEDLVTLFQSARIIIGPHGGALFNLIFCNVNTTVIEFFPKQLYENIGGKIIVWLQAASLGQEYWRIHSTGIDTMSNMVIDVAELQKKVLSKILKLDE